MGGVVEVVDKLLEAGVPIEWDANNSPYQKRVFRAIIARIALLCNQSPYGGEGEILIERRWKVWFVNTSQEQKLRMEPLGFI